MRAQVYMLSIHPFNSFYLDTLESLKFCSGSFCDWFGRLEMIVVEMPLFVSNLQDIVTIVDILKM